MSPTTWYVPARILRALGWPARRVQQAIVTLTPRLRQYAPIVHEGATETSRSLADLMAEAEREPSTDDKPAPDFDSRVWTVDAHAELEALWKDFAHDVNYLWPKFYEWLKVDAETLVELAGVNA